MKLFLLLSNSVSFLASDVDEGISVRLDVPLALLAGDVKMTDGRFIFNAQRTAPRVVRLVLVPEPSVFTPTT